MRNFMGSLMVTVLLLFLLPGASFADAPGLQYFYREDQLVLYIPGVPEEGDRPETGADASPADTVQLQIGADAVLNAGLQPAGAIEGAGIHTFLLLDNSQSISENNRERIIQFIHLLLDGHGEGEQFTLAAYDRKLQVLAAGSTDYSYLHQLADGITFQNQESYLKDVLHEAYQLAAAEPSLYTRFVIFSDGCDDHETGYTAREIRELFEQRSYPLYAVGSLFEENPGALEDLFALARTTGGACMLLDETEDPASFAAMLQEEAPGMAAAFPIPGFLQDGSLRNVRLHIEEAAGERTITSELRMPFAALSAVSAADPSDESSDPFAMNLDPSAEQAAVSMEMSAESPEDAASAEDPAESMALAEDSAESMALAEDLADNVAPAEDSAWDREALPEGEAQGNFSAGEEDAAEDLYAGERGEYPWPGYEGETGEIPGYMYEGEVAKSPEAVYADEDSAQAFQGPPDMPERSYQPPQMVSANEAGQKNPFLLAAGGAVMLAALAVLGYRVWNKRKNRQPEGAAPYSGAAGENTDEGPQKGLVGKIRAMSNTDEDAPTVLLDGTANATDLLQHEGRDVLILIPDGDYAKRIERPCTRQITIGRRTDCDICMRDDSSVSGLHCTIFYNRRGELAVRDHHSSNGTFLNDVRLQEEKALKTGDILEVGRTRYHVQVRQAQEAV